MNIWTFVLGIIVAVVVIHVTVTVIIMLKTKKIEVLSKAIDQVNVNFQEVYRAIEDLNKENLMQAKSYTDSRFDKMLELKK